MKQDNSIVTRFDMDSAKESRKAAFRKKIAGFK